jgi:aldehyde:ferredoxin oxidoreductase
MVNQYRYIMTLMYVFAHTPILRRKRRGIQPLGIQRINLKTETLKGENTSESVYETYLSGKGLGTYLLMKEIPPGVDPLSPNNKLIFCTGPITDTRFFGSCRHGVFAKSLLEKGLS